MAGPLEFVDPNAKGFLLALGAIVAAAAAYYAASADRLGLAAVYFVIGAAAAGGAAFALYGSGAVVFALAIYLVVASAWQTYVLKREPMEIGLWGALALAGVAALSVVADPKTAAFVGASALSIYCALKVIQTQVLVHATIWLAGALFGVAGLYLSLGAEFLALAQVLIYVGAVVTLFLFTVMLTIPEEEAHGLDELELPPGVTIESVRDLDESTPRMGVGPYKTLKDTNPRKPVRSPPTLYGVSMADGVYGDETIEKRTSKKKKEA